MERYESEGIRYGEMKGYLAEAIYGKLKPFQERRFEIKGNKELVDRVIREGAEKAGKIAKKTLLEVKEKMGLKD